MILRMIPAILAGGQRIVEVEVTSGLASSGRCGWSADSPDLFGSISPGAPDLGIRTVEQIYSAESSLGGTADFYVQTPASLGDRTSLFTKVEVEDSTGSIRTYNQVDATFFTSALATSWRWPDGTDPTWPGTDAGSVRTVRFFLA